MKNLELNDLNEIGVGAFFRPRDLAALDISFYDLQGLVRKGIVEKIGHGLYRHTRAPITQNFTLAAVVAQVPDAVICLLSALRYHEIGTQAPDAVWLAIARGKRPPRGVVANLKLVTVSGASLTYGVHTVEIDGVPARITSPARTIVDCFRFRRLVGLDVAIEALQEGLRSRQATRAQIARAAEVLRVTNTITPQLQAMST